MADASVVEARVRDLLACDDVYCYSCGDEWRRDVPELLVIIEAQRERLHELEQELCKIRPVHAAAVAWCDLVPRARVAKQEARVAKQEARGSSRTGHEYLERWVRSAALDDDLADAEEALEKAVAASRLDPPRLEGDATPSPREMGSSGAISA